MKKMLILSLQFKQHTITSSQTNSDYSNRLYPKNNKNVEGIFFIIFAIRCIWVMVFILDINPTSLIHFFLDRKDQLDKVNLACGLVLGFSQYLLIT